MPGRVRAHIPICAGEWCCLSGGMVFVRFVVGIRGNDVSPRKCQRRPFDLTSNHTCSQCRRTGRCQTEQERLAVVMLKYRNDGPPVTFFVMCSPGENLPTTQARKIHRGGVQASKVPHAPTNSM